MIEEREKQLITPKSLVDNTDESIGSLVQLSKDWIDKDIEKSLEFASQSVAMLRSDTAYIIRNNALKNISLIYHKLNDPKKAIEYYNQLLTRAIEQADKPDIASINNSIGIEYWYLSEYKEAEKYLNDGLLISEDIHDHQIMAESYSGLGLVNWKLGNLSSALEYYQQSMDLEKELEDDKAMAILNNYIGIIYRVQGNTGLALEYYNTSYKMFKLLDDKVYMAKLLNNIGNLHLNQGRNQEAIEHYLQSLSITEEMGDSKNTASILNNIGLIYFNKGNFAEGLKFHLRALSIRETLNNQADIAHSLNNIGLVYQKLGNLQESLTYTQRALAVELKIGDKSGIACSYSLMGLIYMELKEYDQAKQNYQKSLEFYELLGDKMGISANMINLGGIHLELNEFIEAETLLQKGLESARELQAENLIRDCYGGFTELYKAKGNYEKALEYMTLFIEIKDTINSKESDRDIAALQTKYELEKQEKEAEIYRLKNIELARANDELRILQQELEYRVEESIKDIRNKEALLITQSRLAEMGKMIGFIAHQWKQPLNTISVIAQSIEDAYRYDALSDASLEKFTTNIMAQIKYMSDTIDDFRNFFKPDKAQTRFDLKENILNTIRLIEKSYQQNDIEITLDLADNCRIDGYPNEFTQVILNILNNARDALTELDKPCSRKVLINLVSSQNEYTVLIGNNAGNIPHEVLPHIFDPYFTTKTEEKGTGLGLFMSKTIIEEKLKGRLSVANKDEGVEFRIEFSRASQKSEPNLENTN